MTRRSVRYQPEVRVVWEGAPGAALRVTGAVDDSDWRALTPLREEFVVRAREASVPGDAA